MIAIKDEQGIPLKFTGSMRDIFKRKQAEKERKELEEKIARLQKMEALGLLAGGVAHDLNNVLSGIVGYPDLLLMDLPPDSPLRKPILNMQSSGQKAVIASGFSETKRAKEAQKLGAGQYVKKPYTLEKIGIAVKNELASGEDG
jgi:signal transduction histidine kinase